MSVWTAAASTVEVRLLGALEVIVDGSAVTITGAKQRALLAVLALNANEIVSRDRLIDAAWGASPPETVQASLNVAVSKLRRVVGGEALVTKAPGYVLRIDDDYIDIRRFEGLVAEGRRALANDDPKQASAVLRDALALWRGAPLADFAYDSFARAEITRLAELRVDALEQRVEAELALSRHSLLVGELEALVGEHPWRERLRAQLMLALYRAGRQQEALGAYRHAREAFLELGIEPSRELQRLQRAILQQDPALDLRRDEPPSPPPLTQAGPSWVPRRLGVVALAGATLVAAAAVVAFLALRPGQTGLRLPSNAVAAIDPTDDSVVAVVRVGDTPAAISVGAGSVWVANVGERTLSRIDPTTRTEARRIGTGGATTALAFGGGSVWALDRARARLLRIDPRLNVVVGEFDLRKTLPDTAPVALAFGERALWIGVAHGDVLRISPESGAVIGSLPATGNGGTLAVGFGSVWAPSVLPNEVRRIDIGTRRLTKIPFERAPSAVAVGAGAVWVSVVSEDVVWRIDPHTNSVARTIPVGDGPRAIAVGHGGVWVGNTLDGTVSRIDPVRNAVVSTIEVGNRPSALAAGAGVVWVTVRHP